MFAVVYSFKVKPTKTREFELAWRNLTELIYKHEGSLGSRLHKIDDNEYIAYANWPNGERWENSGNNLPSEADGHRQLMRAACESIRTVYEMDTIDDFLKQKKY